MTPRRETCSITGHRSLVWLSWPLGLTTAAVAGVAHLFIQGLALKPLLRALHLRDDDPVGHEVSAARERALRAGLASFAGDRSPAADFVRQAFTARLGADSSGAHSADTAPREIYQAALGAARQAVLAMRGNDEIGDDAFHQLEEELDRLEIAVGTNNKW